VQAPSPPWSVTTQLPAPPLAGAYSVDASSAAHETGLATGLVTGAQVKVRGTLNGTLTAKKIEIAGCAGQRRSSPGRH
jgi:hypothetical protein